MSPEGKEFGAWKVVVLIAAAIFVLAGAYYVSSRPMDFRVYHFGARGVADGTRPFYGPTSGLGWPMHYRYPPLFLFLFTPFALLPLKWGAAIWFLLKCIALVFLIAAIRRKLGLLQPRSTMMLTLLIAGPYVVEDLRYGNVQLFIVALTCAALLDAKFKPKRAAACLSLAAATKVWPLFFVPYLVARRRYATALWTIAFTGILTLLPSVFLGFSRNATLLHEWTQQETSIQMGDSEIWFPSQSLRGVMMRYLTLLDYSRVPDGNYPLVNFANLDPHAVAVAWRVIVTTIYIAFLALCSLRGDDNEDWKYDALAFCLLPLMEPFTPKYALVVLLLPAVALGCYAAHSRRWAYVSALLVVGQPLVPGSSAQRLMQVLGVDFVATVFLLIATAIAVVYGRPSPNAGIVNHSLLFSGRPTKLQV